MSDSTGGNRPARPRLAPLMARELRGPAGRTLFFIACLAVGVAAVVAVAGISGGLESGLRREGRTLLAADLVVEGPEPVPGVVGEVLERLEGRPGAIGSAKAKRADLRELVTMVSVGEPGDGDGNRQAFGAGKEAPPPGRRENLPGEHSTRASTRPAQNPGKTETADASAGLDAPRSQLVELKVVSGGYPFYGDLDLDPDRPLNELLADAGVVAAPELLERLGLEVGDTLRVGGVTAEIRGAVLSEPDRLGGAFGFSAGPRLFAGADLFERTGLETTGSRIRYRTLIALPPGAGPAAAEAWAAVLRSEVPADIYDVETWTEAQPALRAGLARGEKFLGLVALLSLLVGGIGVGQTVRAWLAGRLDAVAVLKCLGLRPREIALVYAGQVALLGLAGSLVGVAAGVAVQLAVPRFATGVIPAGLIDPFQPAAMIRGLGLGLGVALLFGLPSLGPVLRVAPVRALRRTVEPLPVPRSLGVATGATVVAGVWGVAWIQANSLVLATQFTLGAIAATALLALAAWGTSRLAAALPRTRGPLRGRFWLRHGLASLARPGAGTLAAIVALGLGVLVVAGLWMVERRLTDELVGNLPEQAPSVFLIDIQPDQWPGVREVLRDEGASHVDSVPVVMARLAAIDGVEVRETSRAPGPGADDGQARTQDGERRWALTREQRLTYLESLPEDNRIVAGDLWSDPAVAEVSVEEDFARDLGVGLASTLRFDIQGVPLELTVTSLRTVDWSTFGINFFLVVEPGVLDRAPQHRIAAARLPPGNELRFQDRIAATFPNVTVLQVREILERVVASLGRIADGVRLVGGFTVLAGMAILAGAVSAGALRRRREVALLKTLGTTRAGVVAAYAVEYALVGLVAGGIGSAGAALLAREVLVRGMEIEGFFHPLALAGNVAVVLGATVALTVAAGLAASARALRSRPIEVLRRE